MQQSNIALLTDGYKPSHWKQYPPGTQYVFSYFESRGGAFPVATFFGLQYLLKRYLAGRVVSEKKVAEARDLFTAYFGNAAIFNEMGWRRIVDVHGGRLPVEIRAVAEGTRVPVGNALMTIVNTDPELPWLTNYLETLLSQVWYPMTVATQSRAMKDIILRNLEQTGDPGGIVFKLHDFGYRGSTSVEAAGIGGAAHLVNFLGTDTLAALELLRDHYAEPLAGFSIPAAEHSTITSWGREHEAEAYRNMLTQFPTGLVAVVSDSYNVFDACGDLWGRELRQQVLDRDGVLVVRPDSGHPPEVVCRVLSILGERFGYTENNKGYRVLNPKVRVIQGDGIDLEMLSDVLTAMTTHKWSGDNIAFGSGGGLLQKVNRDTMRCAFKCSAICRDGVWSDVVKDPATDPGKRSKGGRLTLVRDEQGYRTVPRGETLLANELVPVFRDGELLVDQTLADVRKRAAL